MRLLFASNNAHKLEEVRHILPEDVCVLSLQDVGFNREIDEPGATLEENSAIKAQTVADWAKGKDLGIDGIFADDSGLEIAALGGAPGVHTARWAGDGRNAADNRKKALRELEGKDDRRARFRTVITLLRNGKKEQAEGHIDGVIAKEEHGNGGFGYDPVFIPEGYRETFAELPAETKNRISHRARALEALRRMLLLLSIICMPAGMKADEGYMNQFRIYSSFANTTELQAGDGEIVGLSNGAFYTIQVPSDEVKTYDKTDGLSGSHVSQIGYDKKTNNIVIAYSDGHIDLMNNGVLTQMPDLYMKAEEINTTINQMSVANGRAYLSMTFGIVALNLEKEEVTDTYPITGGVLYTVQDGDTLWAVSSSTLYCGDTRKNLIDYNNWKTYPLPETGEAGGLAVADKTLYLLSHGNLYRWADGWTQLRGSDIRWMHSVNGELLAGTDSTIYRVKDDSVRFTVAGSMAIAYCDHRYYISLGQNVQVRNEEGATEDEIRTDGPIDNMVNALYLSQGRLYVCSGNYLRVNDGISGSVKILNLEDNQAWTNVTENEICRAIGMPAFLDAVSVTDDPQDPHHFYVASYGMGIVEFRDDKPVRQYTDTTLTPGTTLASAAKDNPWYYTRCSALTTDENGYIWCVNTSTTPIHILDVQNGTWHKLDMGDIIMNAPSRRMWIDQRHPNWKWMLITTTTGSSAGGVILLDDGGTPFISTDDRVLRRSSFVDQKGKTITPTLFYTIAQDQNGYIWIGTDKGPICIEHENWFTSNKCTRVIRRRNDGTDLADYLLETETIRAIAIDGGNRKWFGTDGAGLFLVSADGQETVHEFTAKNSNLPSSVITSLAIDSSLGDVYIGTAAGLCSYRADATEGKESMSGAYAYPNPVKPDYEGDIVLSGLMANSWVQIMDTGGKLVFKTMSNGGTAVWDGTDSYGHRVASGVYSAICTAADGGGQTVVKILMLK